MDAKLISTLIEAGLQGAVLIADRVKGNGTGAAKKPLAVNIAKALFDSLAEPGVGVPQDPKEIGGMVEQTVSRLNADGKLKGFDTVIGGEMDAELLSVCASALEFQAKRLRSIANNS